MIGPDWEHGAALLAVVGVVAVALIMTFTGSRRVLRSAGERDGRLIAWALFRLGLGALLWREFTHPPAAAAPWVGAARGLLAPYLDFIVMIPALWLAVTGATRLLLSLWGGARAERLIRRILNQRNAPLVPARRRRFFFW